MPEKNTRHSRPIQPGEWGSAKPVREPDPPKTKRAYGHPIRPGEWQTVRGPRRKNKRRSSR